MGSTPVANPSPPRRWRFSRRVVPLVVLTAFSVAFLAVALMVVWPSSGGGLVNAGQVQGLETEVPVRYDSFYIVSLESGEILALSDTDPHRSSQNPDCPITWRPEMRFRDAEGWFRGTCSGSTFDLTGSIFAGPAPRGMDRYEISIRDGGSITVDTSTPLCAPDYTAVSCP